MGLAPLGEVVSWRARCCVAAFICAALRLHGTPVKDRAEIARRLGTRVGPLDANPWGLAVEADPLMRGVTVEGAQRAIPSLLRELGVSLEFRHVPFAHVTLGMFDELLQAAFVSGCTVGVGYDHALLAGRGGVLRHVCRVQPSPRSDHVLMLDDSTEEPPRPREVRWLNLEEAIQAAKDGFWLIGEHQGLSLPYAPAWPR